ncbi:hypothetical protein V6N11_034785 [Hibiscus sabdariffa]|uniref:Uncharacterized protein n=2 Tax=Hibiscus sabdariffa TaxID=183260 RepID=A0ABR2FQ73_9ROSI
MAWFALCFTDGLLGSLSWLVQFLTGLRFATLAGIALPGCGLCMAWGVAYVGFHYRPRVLLLVWRLPFRLWPILVLFLLAGVALWHNLDMLEDALAMPTGCALLVDIDGVVQSHGEDLVHDAIDAAADTLIREVAASVLGCAPISVDTDATVVSANSAAMTSASPTAPVLSRSAPAYARRLPMPALPEHQEFDAWYAAQTRQASTSRSDQPDSAQAPRAPKRHASHSDPTKAKRPRPSTSSQIPLIPKAGMSSANNSSAETARQSRREK